MKQKLIRKILSVSSFILACVLFTGTVIANENVDVISNALNAATFRIEDKADKDTDTEYYKSDYDKLSDLIEAGQATAKEVMAEGAVLLKNNGALPLNKGDKVSLVGETAYNPVYGGTGSGSIDVKSAVNFVDSLTNAGLVLNPTLEASYTSEEWKQYKRSSSGSWGNTALLINNAPWDVVDAACGSSFVEYGDAAVMVIGRVGGEGYDLIRRGSDGIDNGDGLGSDYLGLSATEISILDGLKQLKAEGKIKKIVVLLNYAGMLEGALLKDEAIDAVLWVGALGLGGGAVGELLVGDMNPSGRLPDTMWMDHAKNPVNVNYDAFVYENAAEFSVPDKPGTGIFPEVTMGSYVVYQEGMYMGYRYTETRYEDVVLGTKNVGDYNYDEVVAYPFGHGLSYADFSLSNVSVTKNGEREYIVKATVKNESDKYSGKFSVPVYVSKPYGDYARKNSIQVPSVELIDFAKTSLLAPGKSETLTIVLDEKFFASYDAYGAEGYVLMDGDYYVAVGGSAHDAVNNVLAAKAQNGVKINQDKMVGGTGDASLVKKFTLSFDKDKYAYSDEVSTLDGESNVRVTNLFDFVDINLYEGRGDNKVEYYSRDNWNAISMDMTNGHAVVKLTEQMAYDIFAQVPEMTGKYNNAPLVPLKYRQPIPTDDIPYPTYGKDAGLKLIDMRYDENGNEISFFDPLWDVFMDQITWEDTVRLVSSGGHLTEAVEAVAKPETNDENGPNGFGGWAFRSGYYSNKIGLAYRKAAAEGHVDADGKLTAEADQDGYRKQTGFPANGILAASMNKELARRVGEIIGEDGIWGGTSGLYGIGLNIHRSPYLGRTCEYYSECGMLSGLIGAAECAGIESKGVHVYNKHCALNDQENGRHGVATWVNEQAVREIYLRAFELPITMGGAFNTMASFSRFGLVGAAACPELANDFLRGECGMKGIIVTDAYGDMDGSQNCDPYYEQVYGQYVGGSDIPDAATPKNQGHFEKFDEGYGKMAEMMRLSAKRVMYQTAWSNAMNGISSDTTIVQITPWWQIALYVVDGIVAAMFLACMAWTVMAMINNGKKRRA